MNALVRRVVIAATLAAAAGCGGGPQPGAGPVRGKVVRDGRPVKVLPNEQLDLTLFGQAEDGTPLTYMTGADADGSFTLDAGDGGITPGRYRVGFSWVEIRADGRPRDKLGGRFGPNDTPFTLDVPAAGETVFDLDRPPPPGGDR